MCSGRPLEASIHLCHLFFLATQSKSLQVAHVRIYGVLRLDWIATARKPQKTLTSKEDASQRRCDDVTHILL
ncbi:hypothetical protein F4802DRAFT_583254 [Xylaria palmicola]|nr:hypothetical protein F4802DRAFT_583254 [Xylaria palmicola]